MNLSQLRTPVTEAEAQQWAIDNLSDLGFNSKSWQSGSWQYTLIWLFSKLYALLSFYIVALAEIAFNSTSVGDALTEFSDSHYDNQRVAAVRAEHTVRLTCSASAGPYTVAAGQLTAQEQATGDGYLLDNTTGGVLASGGTLDLTFRFQTAGAVGNVAIGTITKLQTNLAGVTCTNPDVGDGTSLVTTGADEESDATLQARNTAKWGALSWATPADGYAYMVRQGEPNAARVKVDDSNPRGPGTIDVYIAAAAGVAAAGDVTDAQAVLSAKHAGTPNAKAWASTAQAQNFSANVYVSSAYFSGGSIIASKQTEIETALDDYVNSLDIGGTVLPAPDGDGVTGYLLASEWQGAMTAVVGVSAIKSPSPAADVAITPFYVATVGTVTFTYVAIG